METGRKWDDSQGWEYSHSSGIKEKERGGKSEGKKKREARRRERQGREENRQRDRGRERHCNIHYSRGQHKLQYLYTDPFNIMTLRNVQLINF